MSFDTEITVFAGTAIIVISLFVLLILLCFEKRIYYDQQRIHDLNEVDVEAAKKLYSFPDVGKPTTLGEET